MQSAQKLKYLSIIIPCLNEEGSIALTVQRLNHTLKDHDIPHEIIVIDDGSTDASIPILRQATNRIKELRVFKNEESYGFGRAITHGIQEAQGDAVIIFMADESDDCLDVVKYWNKLQEGYDCVFGSRFIKRGKTFGYPRSKLILNRLANLFIQILFRHNLNDTTNAFKAYRMEVIQGIKPIISHHFNITVEMPLKAMVRGYNSAIVPITWRNRQTGTSKLKIKEMGSRYLFIVLYVWLEKYLAADDYKKSRPLLPVKHP